MERQRNVLQKKENHKISEKERNEMELSNMPDKEFKVMIIKMLTGVETGVEEPSEAFNKELENIKKAPELKKILTDMNNTLEEINRLGDPEERISNLEDRLESTQSEQQKENNKKMSIG